MHRKKYTYSGLVMTVITMLACSLSGPVPTPIETPVHLQSYAPAFQVITIPAGIDLSQPSQVPLYFLDTGGGHYLLYVYETEKLIYDGRELYSGPLAGVYGGWSAGLSHNGLHYAYVLPNTEDPDFTDLYVDGAKVASGQFISQPSVTDDGAHFFYTTCLSFSGFADSCLFKDGTDIFLAENGILEYWVNGDGTTYYALLRDPQSLVRNGEVIYQGTELAHKAFSPNGAHYAYVSTDDASMQHLIVDGIEVRASSALNVQQVTDLGSYCAWDSASQLVFINGVEFPVQGNSRIECYINDDASHSLIHDEGTWLLDGHPVQFPELNIAEMIAGVEMKGEPWVVYRVVK
jgi:hypothetical protein